MEICFYLKRPNSDAPTSIFARISYEGAQIKYYIPEKIKPEFWNSETQRAKETKKFKEYPEFNTRLNNIAAAIRDEYRTYINNNMDTIPGPETFKTLLDKRIKKIETPKEKLFSFFDYFNDFIQRSNEGTRINLKTKTVIVYNTTKGFTST